MSSLCVRIKSFPLSYRTTPYKVLLLTWQHHMRAYVATKRHPILGFGKVL